MSSLRGRYRRSKKASLNPYAGRGLDKFALVSAELEAKREELASQLGTPLSVVRFAIGTHSRWIPIILSPSKTKGIQAIRRAAAALISEDKPALGAGISGEKPDLGGLISEGKTHLGGLISEDETSLGGLISEEKSDLGENTVTNPASSEVEHIVANERDYQRGKLGYLMAATARVLWVAKAAAMGIINMATVTASNFVMLRLHAKAMVKSLPSAKRAKEESVSIAHPSVAMVSPTPSSSSSFSLSIAAPSSSLPLPSPPAPVRIASKKDLFDQVSREAMEEMGSQATKHHKRCKVKGFLKNFSAPSTPRDSRQPTKPFSAAGALRKSSGLCDQAAHMDIREDWLVQKANSHKVLKSSNSKVREMASEKGRKERSEKLGQALAAAGLVLGLSGLMMGYIVAILGVVCWWYILPTLRKAVGDKPFVRRHHHSHDNNSNNTTTNSNSIILNTKSNSKKAITGNGSGKYNLQSYEYKKKVIMEGLLDRGRHSNA